MTGLPKPIEDIMDSLLQSLATFSCALFAGAGLYINAVEHPARTSCGMEVALTQWKPSYKRATLLQAPLAILGFVFALGAWLAGSGIATLLAGVLLGLVVPFTLVVIMPTNNRMMALDPKSDEGVIEALLSSWNALHFVRTLMSVAALAIFIFFAQ
jgi:uncharacterized membrane protein